MAISLKDLQHGVSEKAPVICCYGDEGIGKSKFAANAPNPVFIFTENSLGNLDVARWQANSYEDVMEMTASLMNEDHDFKTVVYDTLDWFEPFLWAYTIKMNPTTERGKPIVNITDYGYGNGYKLALDYWNDFISLVKQLQEKKHGRNLSCSLNYAKISPPDGDSYDAWTLKLQNSDKVSAKDKITEFCDEVLFANWRVALTEESTGFNNTRNRGIGAGERIVYTEKRPAWDAKNRRDLPAQIHIKDKDWADLWQILAAHIPWFKQFGEAAPVAAKPAPKVTAEITAAEPKAGVVQAAELPKFLKKA